MSTLSIEVENVAGKVTALPPHVRPATGRGVLTVTEAAKPEPLKPVELVEGPHGLLVFRGSGLITSEMVQEVQNQIDFEDAVR